MRPRDARVVDEDVEGALVLGDVGHGLSDRRVVGDVELHEAQPELVGGRLTPRRVAGTDQDGVAESGQASGGLAARGPCWLR